MQYESTLIDACSFMLFAEDPLTVTHCAILTVSQRIPEFAVLNALSEILSQLSCALAEALHLKRAGLKPRRP